MKKILFSLLALPLLLSAAAKPVALNGYRHDVKVMQADIIAKKRIAFTNLTGKLLNPADFAKYSIIYYGETLKNTPLPQWNAANIKLLRDYLNQGGILIFSGESAKNLQK